MPRGRTKETWRESESSASTTFLSSSSTSQNWSRSAVVQSLAQAASEAALEGKHAKPSLLGQRSVKQPFSMSNSNNDAIPAGVGRLGPRTQRSVSTLLDSDTNSQGKTESSHAESGIGILGQVPSDVDVDRNFRELSDFLDSQSAKGENVPVLGSKIHINKCKNECGQVQIQTINDRFNALETDLRNQIIGLSDKIERCNNNTSRMADVVKLLSTKLQSNKRENEEKIIVLEQKLEMVKAENAQLKMQMAERIQQEMNKLVELLKGKQKDKDD